MEKNILGPEEDLFQKSLHQEADFYKGIEKFNYKSPWSFALAGCIALFVNSLAFTMWVIFIRAIVEAFKQGVFNALIGDFLVLIFGGLFTAIGLHVTRSLFRKFKQKSENFKLKTILILAIPCILFIVICWSVFYMFFLDANFSMTI
jgi:hypothetical protein